jgi:hypothetical protein
VTQATRLHISVRRIDFASQRFLQRPRWRERVSPEQREELQFLQSLALKARVVYLLER